ncbi:MAG TPA: hypothetical protein VHP11_15520, partial [Tepidisphaeraceae bacterium]|nr:hypothetical protein [Tepidisphaeraceae bacterium]
WQLPPSAYTHHEPIDVPNAPLRLLEIGPTKVLGANKNPETLRISGRMGAVGSEHIANSLGNSNISEQGGAKSGALPPELSEIVKSWAALSATTKAAVLALVRGASLRKEV